MPGKPNYVLDPAFLSQIREEAMAAARIGWFAFRFDGTMLALDPGALAIFDLDGPGVEPDAFAGKNITELVDYTTPGLLREEVKRSGRVTELEWSFTTHKGNTKWVTQDSYLVKDGVGDEEVLQVVLRDVTEKKRAQRALQESQARFWAAIEGSLDAFLLLRAKRDENGIITDFLVEDMNRNAAALLGHTRERILGGSFLALLEMETADPYIQKLVRVVETRMFLEEEFEVAEAPIHATWLRQNVVPVGDGVAITGRDITERKRKEAEAREFESRMLQSQKLEGLGVMAGGIAHDFNNILVGVLGNAELARMTLDSDSKAYQRLEQIEKAARRASALAGQMLQFSGDRSMMAAPMALNSLIEEMDEFVRASCSRKVDIQYHLARDLPPILADTSQMRQCIVNVITNAAESMESGGGAIHVRTWTGQYTAAQLQPLYLNEKMAPGPYVCMEVRDEGTGMKREALERAFDPFFTTKFAGRGMGLPTVLGIVRGHHGGVSLVTREDVGTTITLYLPAMVGNETANTAPAAPRQSGGLESLLLVDDEIQVLTVTSEMLEASGFKVYQASSGDEAVNTLKAHRDEIECVLLDFSMPDMTGDKTFERIKQVRTNVPVIISSGYHPSEVESAFPATKPAGFLQKPYERSKLVDTIRTALRAAAR